MPNNNNEIALAHNHEVQGQADAKKEALSRVERIRNVSKALIAGPYSSPGKNGLFRGNEFDFQICSTRDGNGRTNPVHHSNFAVKVTLSGQSADAEDAEGVTFNFAEEGKFGLIIGDDIVWQEDAEALLPGSHVPVLKLLQRLSVDFEGVFVEALSKRLNTMQELTRARIESSGVLDRMEQFGQPVGVEK
ncbi:hypothetical protein KKC44_03190 [Patescibacteria group bacterium]|nr:hypothetical protein [Patescibacteria group bacterium]MBU2259589.1 hypothetical protein [Patescibacteria group bacterium]